MLTQRVLTLTAFLLLAKNAYTQSIKDDSTYLVAAKANIQKQYYESRRSELLLFQGSDYAEYEAIQNEHPFFLSDDWIIGSLRYNKNVYSNIPLQFDIHSDKLITEHPGNAKKIVLVPQHVSWFTINGHHFVYLDDANIPAGYYEVLVDGKTKLLANYHKAFQESTTTGRLEVRVEEIKRYFIYKNGELLAVKGKSTLLGALDEERSALQQEIKRKRLNFNRTKEKALIESVTFYNNLKQ